MNDRQSTSPVLTAILSSHVFLCTMSWEGYPGPLHVRVFRAVLRLLSDSTTIEYGSECNDVLHHMRYSLVTTSLDSEWYCDRQVHSETRQMEVSTFLSGLFSDTLSREHTTIYRILNVSIRPMSFTRTSLEMVLL